MTDTLEWLVQFADDNKNTRYERFATVDKAIPFLHKVLGSGQRPRLFKETPISLTIDIDPKAPRKRRRKESTERAATPRAEEPTTKDAAAQEPAPSPVVGSAGNPASPVHVFDCEGRFPNDPPCPPATTFDGATKGRFCLVHIEVEEHIRREMHRIHGHRNRPHEAMVRLVG